MAKGVEYFIARRTSKSKKRGGGGVMMPIAKIAVALSIAVMVITIAVVSGFKREIETRLTALSGELVVTSLGGGVALSNGSITQSEEMLQIIHTAAEECGERIIRANPYITRGAIIRGAEGVEGVILKGVGEGFGSELFEEGLIDGEVPAFGSSESGRNALISKLLADEMQLKVGDRIELLTTDSRTQSDDEQSAMRRDLYRVGGIYTRSLGDAEKHLIITDIRNVRRLNSFDNSQISGYEVWIGSTDSAPKVAERVNELLFWSESDIGSGVASYSAQSLYPSLFDWLAAHDVNAAVVIIIMLIVAIFNITTAMLILVLERTRLIGVLKVLGMSSGSIRRIFLYRALSIALWGMLWGNGVAITAALIQQHFNLIKLDEQGYLLSSVPISLGVDWLLMLNCGVAVIIALLVIIPTRMVSQIEPSKAVKYE